MFSGVVLLSAGIGDVGNGDIGDRADSDIFLVRADVISVSGGDSGI